MRVALVAWVATAAVAMPSAAERPVARVVGRVSIGFQAFTTGEGAVWAVRQGHRYGELVRLDPRTLRTRGVSRVGAAANAVVTGAGSVWVANGVSSVTSRGYPEDASVWRIVPGSGRVVARISIPDPTALAVAGGAVWAFGSATQTLYEIDPDRNRVVGRVRLSGAQIEGLAGDGADLWAATATFRGGHSPASALVRVDLAAGAVRARTVVPGQIRSIAAASRTLWLTVGAIGVRALDAGSLRPESVAIRLPSAHGLAVLDGSLWATRGDGLLTRLAPRTGRVLGRLRIARYADAVWPLGPDLWVGDFNEQTIVRVRPG